MPDEEISLSEAARISGVSASTLQRWAGARVVPVKRGRWTRAAAAQARVVARMRERGHSLNALRRAARDGRLAFGYVEDLIPRSERAYTRAQAAELSGLEEELIERIMSLLGTPTALEGTLTEQDVEAMKRIAEVLDAGFPLVAVLQLVRVYAQSVRKIAEAEVRLFHLYVHEPLIRDGVDALQMAADMEGLVEAYSENAVVRPAGMAPARGREAVRSAVASWIDAAPVKRLAYTTEDLSVFGDTVFQVASFTGTVQPKGSADTDIQGSCALLWVHDSPEGWKIERSLCNSGPAPAQR